MRSASVRVRVRVRVSFRDGVKQPTKDFCIGSLQTGNGICRAWNRSPLP